MEEAFIAQGVSTRMIVTSAGHEQDLNSPRLRLIDVPVARVAPIGRKHQALGLPVSYNSLRHRRPPRRAQLYANLLSRTRRLRVAHAA